jgi:putative FmdB family regulatory protein
MPLYEYGCEACGKEFEAYKRLSDEKAEEVCPACGGSSRRRGISLFRTGGSSAGPSAGGSSCGAGPRRSPFR